MTKETTNVIETEELRKSYGAYEAVRGLSLRVPRGSIYGFLGRNGAGKSTTIKMLLGMTRPCSGSGRVLAKNIADAAESLEIRRLTGFVSEEKGLYDYLTVEQMIAFTRGFFPLWRRDLEERYVRLFELPPARRVRALSKGMRTKLALLLALARGGRLLILDEPTEGLDPAMVEEVLQALVRLVNEEELTIFFSSHQIAEVEQIAERILLMHEGREVLEGALDELKENYRRVRIAFAQAPSQLAFSTPGIERIEREGRWASVFVSRNAAEVAAEARSGGAVAVDVAPVSLKEIFLETVREERLLPEREKTGGKLEGGA